MRLISVRQVLRFSAPLILASAAACDATGTDRVPVAISFSGRSPGPSLDSGISADVTVAEGDNTLVITRAQLIVRDVELKRTFDAACSDDDGGDDDCQKVTLGPFLVDLPVTDNTIISVTASVPPDTYREIEFEIHKLGDDTPEERALAAEHPEFDDHSIRVEGTFNGTPFVFMSDLNEDRELEFSAPLVIDESNQNVTIQFDLADWFRSGSAIIDPATANKGGANENLVKENIRASIRAFRDDDRDGR